MIDPTRIPRLLESVRQVWEGQPDLSFGAVVTILENRGMNWSSTDDEIIELCAELSYSNPPKLPAIQPGEFFRVVTTQPQRVYVFSSEFVVPDTGQVESMTPWHYSAILQSAVGGPLKVVDSNGTIQRLGIVTLISRCHGKSGRALIVLDDDTRVLVDGDQAMIATKLRRELQTETLRLKQQPQIAVGDPLVLAVASDKSHCERTLAVVSRVHEMEE